ncbi:hypothetical protein RFI_33975, partial [Reticulomyxa filosa]
QSDFEYVAIACVDDFNEDIITHSSNAKFPYYFVIFQQSLIQKKYSVWNNKENVCIDYSNDKLKVGAWYAEPGKCNVFHCITLFALFVHLFLNDHLNGTQLQQTNFLGTVLGLI